MRGQLTLLLAGAVAFAAAPVAAAHHPAPLQAAHAFAPLAPGMAPTLGDAATRRWIRRRRSAIPLPPGGTFAGIAIEQAALPLPLDELDLVLQLNARCQWLRAVRDGRGLPRSRLVLAATAAWPAVRLRPPRPPLTAGDPELRDCDASHRRETAYARRRGARPPR